MSEIYAFTASLGHNGLIDVFAIGDPGDDDSGTAVFLSRAVPGEQWPPWADAGVVDGISGSAANPDPLGLTAQHAERIGERGNTVPAQLHVVGEALPHDMQMRVVDTGMTVCPCTSIMTVASVRCAASRSRSPIASTRPRAIASRDERPRPVERRDATAMNDRLCRARAVHHRPPKGSFAFFRWSRGGIGTSTSQCSAILPSAILNRS